METAAVGVGDRVAGRTLEQLLGRGGEGEVWRAVADDDSPWALKLLRPDVLPGPDEVARRGAWLVDIDHPSLVTVSRGGRFTSGTLAGWGFVEMELIEGPSLALAGPMPDALEELGGLAEALDLLHAGAWSQGVPLIHRDIKPGNLIEGPDGLVLVDPSTMRGLDTRDLTRIGTPAYLAPEVLTGRFGPLADIYSLAATAAALLTGCRGHDLSRLLLDPEGLPASVVAGLAEEPARRPGTCAAVLGGEKAISPPSRSVGWADLTERTELGGEGLTADPDVALESVAPARGAGWVLPVYAVVLLVPSLAWAAGPAGGRILTWPQTRVVLVASAVLHAAVHLATRRPLQGLLAPPWAWGALLASRVTPAGRRRRWLSDAIAGVLVLGVLVAAVSSGRVGLPVSSAEAWPLAAMAAIGLSGAAVGVARSTSRLGHLLGWLVLSPAWVVGSALRYLAGGSRTTHR